MVSRFIFPVSSYLLDSFSNFTGFGIEFLSKSLGWLIGGLEELRPRPWIRIGRVNAEPFVWPFWECELSCFC